MRSRLGPGEVRVEYCLTERLDADALRAAAGTLSIDERARAARFVRDEDRRDFTAAHALLRTALSGCAPAPPDAWTFVVPEPGGKPALGGGGAPPLSFNLAHTSGLVACVVSSGVEVGIDVERVDRAADAIDLARRFFSPREVADLEACASGQRQARFIDIWTLKEAFVKAIGRGLAEPLDRFGFAIDADGTVRFDPPAGADAAAWQFARLAPSPRHRLAVAVAAGTPPGCRIGVRERRIPAQESCASAIGS